MDLDLQFRLIGPGHVTVYTCQASLRCDVEVSCYVLVRNRLGRIFAVV